MRAKPQADDQSAHPADLRGKAEERLRESGTAPDESMSDADARALVHELQVHRIELEMQNEELQRAQTEASEVSEKYYDLFDFAPVGYFLWNQEGRILEVNLAGAALLGLDRRTTARKRFGQFVAPQSRETFVDFLKSVLVGEDKQACEIVLLRDGRPIDVLIEGIAAHGGHGESISCRAAVIDISQRRRADELAAANEALQAEIAARKKAETALKSAKAAAEDANHAKSEFLANVSHELRTPMNAILGMLDLALPKQTDSSAKDFLQTARESAGLLLSLLNDLLDSAKIESGKMELESAPFSLGALLRQICQVFAVRASEKGIGFACQLPPELPDAVVGDLARLRQILFNLIENAVKFTDRGEVVVSVRVETQTADEATLEFTVRDTGIGMRQSEIAKIFVPFAQADPSTTRRFGGTGLGLALCAHLVNLMGTSPSKAPCETEALFASPFACQWLRSPYRKRSQNPSSWKPPNVPCISFWSKTTPPTRNSPSTS
jgi:PAS domain S-box-containing protein